MTVSAASMVETWQSGDVMTMIFSENSGVSKRYWTPSIFTLQLPKLRVASSSLVCRSTVTTESHYILMQKRSLLERCRICLFLPHFTVFYRSCVVETLVEFRALFGSLGSGLSVLLRNHLRNLKASSSRIHRGASDGKEFQVQ